MKIYLQSKNIPELSGLNFQQRMDAIEKAGKQLTTPERVLLNTLKLLLLTLAFVWIFYLSSLLAIVVSIISMAMLYPLITRPVHYYLCRKYLRESS